MTYAEKLKDPRWQKRRLEIFERDGWACCLCKNKSETLHVHHKRYRDPWNATDDDLVTLCEMHHAWAEILISDVRERAADQCFMLALERLIKHHQNVGDDVWKIFIPIFPDLAEIANRTKS